jgi:tetratricopeptide (TPR) repeat protein
MVDSATATIARDLQLAPPFVTVAQIRTSSPGAYALYEEGLRAHYGYDGPAAYRLMKAALARDSTFAMAAYYVWQLSRTYDAESTGARAMARAKQLATRSIERERLLIQGSIAEVDAPLQQALAIAETLTVKYSTDPEGHILLGNVRGRAGDWAGSVEAYDRAVVLDSLAETLAGTYCRVCTALAGMVQQYLWWDSAGAAERAGRRLIALRPGETMAVPNLIEPLLRQQRRREAEETQIKTDPHPSDVTRDFVFNRDDIRWGHYEEADRALRESSRSPNEEIRSESWWLLILSLRDQGRLREADSVMLRWRAANIARGYDPATQSVDLAMVALEMGKPEVTIRSYRGDAERTARSSTPAGVRNRYLIWYLTLAGTAYAAAGDTAVVSRLADSLETLGQTSQFGRDTKLHYFLRGLLFQREGRHAEAVDAFRRSLFSLTDGFTRTNLMMARSLLALHRPAEAIAVLRPAIRGGVDGSNTYVSRTELHESMAQALEQAGQRDSAVFHWRAVESGWRHADPQFRDRYLTARQKAGL